MITRKEEEKKWKKLEQENCEARNAERVQEKEQDAY
jgi:hypothetical protein